MNKTIVVCSSNRGLEEKTHDCVQLLQQAGASYVRQKGSADVAFARNQALSWVCNELRRMPERDAVLMVDDDMTFSLETAQALVDYTRAKQRPASAVYGTLNRLINAVCMSEPWQDGERRWRVGLGCIAIPAAQLLALETMSEPIDADSLREFCWTRARDGEWMSEDFCLSERLGGVALLPLEAGHLKKVELLPDPETLRRIAAGEDLPMRTREELQSNE